MNKIDKKLLNKQIKTLSLQLNKELTKTERDHFEGLLNMLGDIADEQPKEVDSYEIFLMIELGRLKGVIDKELEYDIMFKTGKGLVAEFENSKYNTEKGLYECISEFLDAKPKLKLKKEKIFPNSFNSWQETHFEVVEAITLSQVSERREIDGRYGLVELAKELTDKFEKLNKGREWDGEFYDEIDAFLKEKLK